MTLLTGRTLRRDDKFERSVFADGQIVEIGLPQQRAVLTGPQRVGAHLGKDDHSHRTAIAPQQIAAALLDDRRFVDRVGIGLEDVLRNVQFGHEYRMGAITDKRI